ncbi:epidermis-specific secreted glycoprotein EP1-like [Tasmannia lanceolata]|uniref:epidermis-specific secreted glycoprotein EP1-like n=1 Tax=Tasmannia lanceolata TaxID=3420 RepID=UPI00406390E7
MSTSLSPSSISHHNAISFLLFTIFAIREAIVPPSKTFKYINQGEFGEYIVEHGANYRVLDVYTAPFQLCFYNSTPNAFTLALRMGTQRSESVQHWVWEANRANPVHENATLTFGRDGNLVLADPDGQVVWQTGTANQGVVGFELLPNGNMVLHDRRHRLVWQSFDHPTDTLLVGQVLRQGGPSKLVSRASDSYGSEGPYSLVLEPNRLALYLKNSKSSKPLLYNSDLLEVSEGPLANVIFSSAPETLEGYAYELRLGYTVANSSMSGTSILSRPKYNTTLSFLRLEMDGNVKIYTYNNNVDWGAWEVTFTLFSRDGTVTECRLPSRCGSFGLCEENQCVACPRPQGLLEWSTRCSPPNLPPCKGMANVDYYKVAGADHFMNPDEEGQGPMKLVQCREKCSKDCECVGFFYRETSSKCLLVPVLSTLIKVSDSSHLAFIKVSK